MLKTCIYCNETKGIDLFYSHPKTADGKMGKCKECHKEGVKGNRRQKLEYYRAFDRMRANDPERVFARKEYQNTPEGKEKCDKGKKDWISRNRDKRKAHILVGNHIRAGGIEKQPCENCSKFPAQAHHEDYSKPLDIRWLCAPCHAAEHKEERGLKVLRPSKMKQGTKRYTNIT